MQPYSSAVVLKVLEGLTARLAVTAENIANASTPNYRPLRVSFEDALSAAAQRGDDAVRAVKPQITQEAAGPDARGTRLDVELTADTTAAMRYSAVVEVLNREFQLELLAVTGGNQS